MKTKILGISAYYHDSAAALLIEDEIVAAAQEERFTRKKHDPNFPENAVRFVLSEAGLKVSDLSSIVFYDKPLLKFERLLETYHSFAPRGLKSFFSAVPVWIKEKLFIREHIRTALEKIQGGKYGNPPQLLFAEHHLSHCASAFYPSPFESAGILTLDGVGEWATLSISRGKGSEIEILKELHFPHSVGLLYSAFTYYCGFRVNSGEYKLMGLAPYGNAESARYAEFKEKILSHLMDIRPDGSVLLNMDYFSYATGLRMCDDAKWTELFGIPPRRPESAITQAYNDLALAIQHVTEDIVFRLAATTKELTQCDNLVLAGGVALNCVANGKLLHSNMFKHIWIQPAAGDAGGALGAAYAGYYLHHKKPRHVNAKDSMKGAQLGPAYGDNDIESLKFRYDAAFQRYHDYTQLCDQVAEILDRGDVVGWFQGRMEWGPRALGNRSILGDARNPEMQKKINLKIKRREAFRPFAPAVLLEEAQQYFNLQAESPYMLLIADVREDRRNEKPAGYEEMELLDRLYFERSDVPAVTHIDYSARVQTVSRDGNEKFWILLNAFRQKTGYGILITELLHF